MFHVVLHQPEIPPNTGNAIRLCANAAATLHLIRPLGFRLDERGLRRSGLDYHALADVKVHVDLESCLEALAGSRLFTVETSGRRCYSDVPFMSQDAFLFGSETRGLPSDIVSRIGIEHSLFIPMRPANRSINLSNAVAIVVFEAWRQAGFAGRG